MTDYLLVKHALAFIASPQKTPLTTEKIARAIGLTPVELTALLQRWCGLTPLAFLHTLTLDYAHHLLRNKASVLEGEPPAIHYEAISPEQFRKSEECEMAYGFHETPFGMAIVVAAPHGLAGMGFCEEGEQAAALADMQRRWTFATLIHSQDKTTPYVESIFENTGEPLKLFLIGTDFEVQVWQTLLKIPAGFATTYGAIAAHLQRPKASRAVGGAIGKNPVALVVPCHRVIGHSGAITGYHWGLTRKQAMLAFEKGRLSDVPRHA